MDLTYQFLESFKCKKLLSYLPNDAVYIEFKILGVKITTRVDGICVVFGFNSKGLRKPPTEYTECIA